MHWSSLPTRDFSRWVWNQFFLKNHFRQFWRKSLLRTTSPVWERLDTTRASPTSELPPSLATKWIETTWIFLVLHTLIFQILIIISDLDIATKWTWIWLTFLTFAISTFGPTFMIFKILTIVNFLFAWSDRCHHVQPQSGRLVRGSLRFSQHDIQDLQLIQWAFWVHFNVLKCQTKHYRTIFKSTPLIHKKEIL